MTRASVQPRPSSRLRIEAAGIGETIDTITPFADQDARRRLELDAAIEAEREAMNRGRGPKRRVIKCKGCGDPVPTSTSAREYCGPCVSRPSNRRLERAAKNAAATSPTTTPNEGS